MRLRPPFRFLRFRWPLGLGFTLALAAGLAAATPVHGALPCRATASSTNAGQAGTVSANTVDGQTGTFLQTNFGNWQHVQLSFECEIEIAGFRRFMARAGRTVRGDQGEQFLVSQDGVNWTYVTRAASTGWQIYYPYHPQAWHSVAYGWSAWLRPTAPMRARHVRFRWDGDADTLNEIDLDARAVFRVEGPKLTQNGLVTRPLPPMPIVAGKTSLVVGRIAALAGGPARADAARLEIVRQDTGALVGSVNGFAFAADDRSLLPAIPAGEEVHFFLSGSDLTLAGPLRFEVVLTAGGRTDRHVLLSNVTTAENEGVSLMLVDHDEGVLRGLNDLLRFADVLEHTARMLPIKDSHGSLLPTGFATRGAVGLRYEYTMNLPLPELGTLGDPRREFVLTRYTQGDLCSANPPNRTFFGNRVVPINFTGVEDLDRNGVFGASEVTFCTNPPAGSSGIFQRFSNWQNRVTQDSAAERNRVATRNRLELTDFQLALVSGGGNRQNPSGLLGIAGPRQGWATLTATGTNFPGLPHELTHELGIPHSNVRNLPGPGYDLARLRRVRQPLALMFADIGFPVEQAFLTDAEFDTARAQLPAATVSEAPRRQQESLAVTGVLLADQRIDDLALRVQPEELEGEILRRDLELVLLDELGEVLVTGPAELLPPGEEDLPPGLPAGDDWPWRGEIPWQDYKDAARWLIVRDRAMELVREDLVQLKPTVKLLQWDLAGDPITVSWDGSHPFGHSLLYDVAVEYPGGRVFPLATGTALTSLSLPAGRLPGGTNLTLKVLAAAGVHTAQDQVTGLVVPNRAPEVVILAPTSGETFAAGSPVQLIAFARDPEDGGLVGSSLTWTSSRSGALGTGSRLAVVLPAGTHVLRVTARDSVGTEATAEVTVTVQ
jgi:hypothetical protein